MKKLIKLEKMADDYLIRGKNNPTQSHINSDLENRILNELSEIKNSRLNSESKLENQNTSEQKVDRESVKKLNFSINTSPNRDYSINKSINLYSDKKDYKDLKQNPYESNPNRKDDSRNLEDITLDNNNENSVNYNLKKDSLNTNSNN